MARRCGGATSRFAGEISQSAGKSATSAVWLCFCLLFPSVAEAGLYTASDQVLLLSPDNVEALLINSTAAILAEFYASWCGHCIAFSPVYKSLARDIKEWKPAVDLAAIDCAAEENRKVCTAFGIRAYPTIKFFHAYSKADSTGQSFRTSTHDVRVLRHMIIDKLENHEEPWPPACPPLEPTSQAEIDSFFETSNVQHLALIFEDATSYIGREVTLDLLQFENVAVRRVLSTEDGLVTKLGVTEFPSCYLYSPEGNFTKLKVNIEARAFYSYALQCLPGVRRSGKPPPVAAGFIANNPQEPWKPFNRSRVYMADLESTLHHSLRVELAAHTVVKGGDLTSLREYVSVLAKYFPGRPVVVNLLKSLNAWLQNQTGEEISYEALREILDNAAQSPNIALPEGERWVGCQGSQPHFRRYPCGMWSLFHVLTVQAKEAGGTDPKEVLSAMRSYVRSFFGCRACAEHFEIMAEESLVEVNTLSSAVLWLWSRHNRVNNRLAGALSEDPDFPKLQWPSPEMCPACHSAKDNGDHRWNQQQVLPFLVSYFSSSSVLADHLEDESQILAKQREKHALLSQQRVERKAREALDSMTQPLPSQSTVQDEEEEEEEEEEGPQDQGEQGGERAAADEMQRKTPDTDPWGKPQVVVGRGRRQVHRKPRIVGLRIPEVPEDIVDLDSFVNQHYKAKALQGAAATRVKQRSLQRKEERAPGPVFGLGPDLDAGLGMVGLQPLEADFELDAGQRGTRLQKRELTGRRFAGEAELTRWVSVLSIGFSKVDISLCVILYFLSSMCLLAMYLFFKNRLRLRRGKVALP
ncbi:sulfhydryl oxidase 1 [Pungitius pungitius]|uniref:sulfhydryl oxidase 1 n=1 Tax=Pungitius pungitius TaxID=134920 RepID=UPI002E12F2F0